MRTRGNVVTTGNWIGTVGRRLDAPGQAGKLRK